MTQEAISLRTSGDSYPGISVIQDVNKALATVATDFAGLDDPAALAGPYMTWADTGSGLLKRRNAAGSAWEIERVLFRRSIPEYALADIPATDVGDIWVSSEGPRRWGGTSYVEQIIKASPSISPGDVVVQSQVLGVAQSWQNMTSMTVGTTFTNSSSKPRFVSVSASAATATAEMFLQVAGQVVAGAKGYHIGDWLNVYSIVPAGATYGVLNYANLTGVLWKEIRE